jgi:YVTN family beta-propeller protein
MLFRLKYFLPALLLLLAGCEKTPDSNLNNLPAGTAKGFIICNEGNFMWGNASVSFFNLETNQVYPDVFKQANNINLGDVLQSAVIYNNLLYLVVNNSEKIEVVNPITFKQVATIRSLKSPRYLLPVNNSKAYVSDLYNNAISIINLNTNTVEGKINMPGWTEEMLLYQNKAYITLMQRDFALVVDAMNNTITDTIWCGYASNSIVLDKNNNIWLAAGGSSTQNKKSTLTCYNPQTKIIEKQFTFEVGSARKLIVNNTGDVLYWISNGNIFSMPINSTNLPDKPLITSNGRTFYNIDFYKEANLLVVTDAKDYVQHGDVLLYKPNGILQTTVKAGIIPSEICFY